MNESGEQGAAKWTNQEAIADVLEKGTDGRDTGDVLGQDSPSHTFYALVTKEEVKRKQAWGTWVAQLVKHLPLNLGSGLDLTVCEFKPCIGLCADGTEPAWDSLSLSLSPLMLSISLSLSLSLSFSLSLSE